MIKSRKIKTIALTLCTAIVLCSCNGNQGIPELVEPVGSAPTFRPVEKNNIGVPKIIIGSVMGTEYCHYYEKMIEIKDIKVNIGDYVNEGDILVEANVDSVKEQITGLNEYISLLNAEHEADEKKAQIDLERLELQKEEAEYKKNLGFVNEEYVKSFDDRIDTYNENHTFSVEMYEFNKRKTNESVTELNKIVEEGVLRAKKSGYVTYKKDLKNGNTAYSFENLVIVTDPEDLYIAAQCDTRSYSYGKYPVKFAFIEGKKVPIYEYDYSDSESVYAKAQNQFPIQRFKTEEDVNVKIGDYVLLEFFGADANDVLTVGKDSVNTDDQGSFVYVKKDDGSLEKRYFDPGTSDDHNYEVLGGLEEGEMVLFTQEATLPKMDGQYEVKLKTFSATETAKGIKYVEESIHTYFSPDEGEVDEIYVRESDEIKKGDPLLRIVIDSEKGTLVGIENKIKSENRDYDNFVKDSEKELEDLNKTISDSSAKSKQSNIRLDELNKALADPNTSASDILDLAKEKAELELEANSLVYTLKYAEMDLKTLEINKELRKKQHDNTLASLNRQYANAKKDNDGTGYKTIYADYDAKVTSVSVSKGDKVTIGKKMIESAVYFDNVIKLGGSHDPEAVGYNFNIHIKEDDYNAEVVAGNNNQYMHVFTENGKIRSTSPTLDLTTFYVRIDDEDFFDYSNQFMTVEVDFEKLRVENMYCIPKDYLFKEISFDNKEYYYVWVLNGDEPYKRYVEIGTYQKLGTFDKPVIISGLNEGDILVK